jgi:hypothetical protein
MGATLYQGAGGRFLGIFNANVVSVAGLKIFGYTGGVLDSSRQNDALIAINYSSKNVTISNNYLTNSLGDCIYIGGSLVAGGELNFECRNISIVGNTLKERYGNNIRSYLGGGGSRSRLCIAVIDCVGLNASNNTIYGGVDLEPNLDGQHLVNISVDDNRFYSGNVTAQSAIGTTYWHDEPTNLTGGSVIDQTLVNNGVAGAPVVSGCTATGNTFDYGTIFEYGPYIFDSVRDNIFQKGVIIVGSTSGGNYTSGRSISGNVGKAPLTGQTTFIRLDGNVALS